MVDRVVVKPGSPGARMWNGHRFNPDDVVIEWVKPRDQDITAQLQVLVLSARQSQAVLAGR